MNTCEHVLCAWHRTSQTQRQEGSKEKWEGFRSQVLWESTGEGLTLHREQRKRFTERMTFLLTEGNVWTGSVLDKRSDTWKGFPNPSCLIIFILVNSSHFRDWNQPWRLNNPVNLVSQSWRNRRCTLKPANLTKHGVKNWNDSLFTHYEQYNSIRKDLCATQHREVSTHVEH